MTESGVEWRPGRLDRVRALGRRALLAVLGNHGERRLHAAYHRFLRGIGRFGPPEDNATTAMLRAVASRSRTIIDVGANAGRYARFLRQHARHDATVIALEPHPDAANLLRAAVGPLTGCTVLELAAADTDGTAALVVPRGAFGSPVSALAWVASHGASGPDAPIKIRLRRLDGLVEDGTIDVLGPVFMKIDVEGNEAAVMRGGAQLLRRSRPVIYFECQAASLARQGETPERVWDELSGLGYRMFGNRAGRFVPLVGIEPAIVNYLGIPDLDPTDAIEALDPTTLAAVLDAWAARTSQP